MKILLLILSLAVSAIAQNGYTLVYNPTGLSGTAMVVTIQEPASGGYDIRFKTVTVSCPTACKVTIERDGTTASATSATPAKSNPGVNTVASKAQAYTASNSSGGTVVGTHYLPAGSPVSIDLTGTYLAATKGTARQNLTVRTANVTGDGAVNINWDEVRP